MKNKIIDILLILTFFAQLIFINLSEASGSLSYYKNESICFDNLPHSCRPDPTRVYKTESYDNTALSDAFDLYKKRKYKDALKSTNYFISHYSKKAKDLQASLTEYVWESAEKILFYKELNDVSLALLLKAEVLIKLKRFPEAQNTLQNLIENYHYGQCYCPNGFFVKPVEFAQQRLDELRTKYIEQKK